MKNVIRYATLLAKGRFITCAELPEELTENEENPVVKSSVPLLKDESYEISVIRNALRECNFNKTRAAQMLGIDRKTLYNKLKAYHIEL